MSFNAPAVIQSFWKTQSGLPSLWLEYAPEPLEPPLAILEATGFSRNYISAGMKQDTHNYKIMVLTTSAETTWTTGEAATVAMENLAHDKIIAVRISPDNLAKPVQVGQVDLWVFEFSVEIDIFDN